MIAAAYVIGYLIIGAGVGKLCANAFLNFNYKKRVRNISDREFEDYYKKTQTYEQWLHTQKRFAYEYSLDATDMDRPMAIVTSIFFWPVTLSALIVHYIYMAIKNSPLNGRFNTSAAARDIAKSEKAATQSAKKAELENQQIEDWNHMIDILDQNNLNVSNLEKRKKVKG